MNIKDKFNSLLEAIKRFMDSKNKCVNPFLTHSFSVDELNTIADILNYHPEARKFVDEWKTVCESKFNLDILKTFLEENGIPLRVCMRAGINLFYAEAKCAQAENNSKHSVEYFYTLSEYANTHTLRDFIYFAENYTLFDSK